ncbi:MAG TPA: TIGR00282 family metallophosphoesterase [Gaiellales bacterium]|nr:TIGR00282 family metallophosphoesterase [Gaiellales bacterium]
MRILFIADAFATPGRRVIEHHVPRLRAEHDIGFVVANGENLADGTGITSRLARRLHAAGVDVITLGNHAFRQREVYPHLGLDPRIVRPANYPTAAPGRGWCVAKAADGTPVAVINLLGKLFLDPAVSPFAVAEDLVAEARRAADLVLVDFHAEATSEKVAMGRLLDGRVTAVVGTHTHVQTSDAHVLQGGTAYITDAGMTGPHDSVIGVRTDLILRRFTTQMPVRFEPADGGVRLEGVVIECDGGGRASSIEAIRIAE